MDNLRLLCLVAFGLQRCTNNLRYDTQITADVLSALHTVVSQHAMKSAHNPVHLSPSSTPVTIEAKLSSSNIISAACLLTSEPAIPIATPADRQAHKLGLYTARLRQQGSQTQLVNNIQLIFTG